MILATCGFKVHAVEGGLLLEIISQIRDDMFKWSRVNLGSMTRMSSMSSDNGFLRPTRIPYKVLYSLLFTLLLVIIVLLLPSGFTSRASPALLESGVIFEEYSLFEYNSTYPLTAPTSE